MHLSKHPLFSFLFLIAAASNFNPVSAGTAFESTDDLRAAVNSYCDGTFNAVTSPYGSIEDWDVSGITDMESLFYYKGGCNPDIGDWDVSKVINFVNMFNRATAFNQDISDWDVSSGTNFGSMFSGATTFNQDISDWDVGSGLYFNGMFVDATAFNQDISSWDVGSGINFRWMFKGATAFNQDISDWDVSSGNDFSGMFDRATAFNQDISGWNVSSGIYFSGMFHKATAFNQNISKWDVSSGTGFHWMFNGAGSFDQPSLYCNWQTNNYFTTGTDVCTNGAKCGWGETSCPLPDCATCGGDPHLKTFFGHSYSYHGQCDMVLLKSREFAAHAGLDIHIRTTRVDNAKVGYSYISGVAVKLGFDVLEVMDDGELILNGNAVSSPTTFAAGHPLRKTFKGNNNKIIVYDLDLTAIQGVPEPIQIRVNTKAKMIFVDVYGRFPDGLGLLGPPSDDSRMLARDGVTDLVGEWNSFGEEWQVRSDEPKLFHENRAPQHPQGCVYESSNTRPMTLRRRLMDGSAVTEKDAEGACSGSKGKSKEFCIADVMATGMLDLAEDEFYLIHE